MNSRPHLNSKYLGLHSCRYQAVVIEDPHIYHTRGSYIVRRNLNSLEEIFAFQAHNSMVSAIIPRPRQSPSFLISVDYYGTIAMHTINGEFLLALENTPKSIVPKCVRSAVGNNDGSLIAILSTSGNTYNGIIELYSVSASQIQKIKTLRGNFRQCEFINENDLFTLRESAIEAGIENLKYQKEVPIPEDKCLDDFESENDEFLDGETLLEVMIKRSSKLITYYACVFFNVKNEKNGKFVATNIFSRINCIKQNYSGKVAFATMNRTIHVMDMLNLIMIHRLTVKGGGSICMLMFDKENLYFSPQAYYFCKFDTTQQPLTKEFDVLDHSPELITLKTTHS